MVRVGTGKAEIKTDSAFLVTHVVISKNQRYFWDAPTTDCDPCHDKHRLVIESDGYSTTGRS